jgi:glycine oxidase ThiO
MKCDVAVIGGGVIGLACAWRLAQGGAKVVLFKREENHQSASWAAAGMLAPIVEIARHPPDNPDARTAMLNLGLWSKLLYPAFVEELYSRPSLAYFLSPNLSSNNSHSGFVYLASNKNDTALEQFLHWGNLSDVQHFDSNTIPLSESESCIAGPATHDLAEVGRAFWLPQEGWVDNGALWQVLLRTAEHAGVTLLNEPVLSIEISGKVAEHIITVKRKVEFDNLLVCAGAWSGTIHGLPDNCVPPVRPVKGHMLRLTRPRGEFSKAFYTSNFYLVPRHQNLLLGSTMEERDDFRREARGVWQLLDAAQKVFPKLLDQQIEKHWTGLRPATPDGLPILGRTPVENLFVATGHFRNGILLTPITAQLMADCILNGKEPPPEFSINRFYAS